VLFGYGVKIDSPIPDQILYKNINKDKVNKANVDKAKDILAKAGWTLNSDGVLEKKEGKNTKKLEFSIATADTPDLKETAEIIKAQWEAIGAKVNVKIFEYGDLYQNIISTRKYDALLFGEFVGKDLDLYAFWHSSQRTAPGLNVAMYVNSRTDKLLEDARVTFDEKERTKLYSQFDEIIERDVPAIFLYSPEFMYIVPEKVGGIDLKDITTISDRFYNIEKWYVETEDVWKIFVNKI
jgi:peptide/nickel transport system substrate-binding protein